LPIAGDKVYGRGSGTANERALGHPALHAAALGFVHPRSGKSLYFEAPLPADLDDLLANYRQREAGVEVAQSGRSGRSRKEPRA
jgi:23S rRNA pseudouridine1911/1915/1917 synthase